jgi:hypothetical protein
MPECTAYPEAIPCLPKPNSTQETDVSEGGNWPIRLAGHIPKSGLVRSWRGLKEFSRTSKWEFAFATSLALREGQNY